MRALIFIAVFAAAGVAVWFGRDDLVDALERQQIEAPKILKTKPPETSEMTEADFIKAVMYRNLDSAKAWLEKGGSPDVRSKHGDSALMWAVNNRQHELVRLLVGKGADVTVSGSYGYTPIHWASRKDFEMLRLLVELEVDHSLPDDEGRTPLLHALEVKDYTAVRFLLAKGANPNKVDIHGDGALHVAIKEGAHEMVEALVLAGANPELPNQRGDTPLNMALELDVAALFLKKAILDQFPDMRKRIESLTTSERTNEDERPEFDIAWLEKRIHELVNEERKKHRVMRLGYDANLADVARAHSVDMDKRDFFAHDNPSGESPKSRALRMGYRAHGVSGNRQKMGIGENIFQGFTHDGVSAQIKRGIKQVTHFWITPEQVAQEAVEGWMNSPGHRANILNSDYDLQGIGVHITSDERVFVTQNFW